MLKVRGNRPVVAFVSNSCWSLYNFRPDVLRHFMQQGYRVLAIAPRDEHTDKLLAFSEFGQLSYYEIQLRNSTVDPVADLKLYKRLSEIYEQELPDIIFHYVTKPVIYGSIAAGSLGIPSIAVITGLGYVYSADNLLSKVVSFLFRFSLRKTKKVWFLNSRNAAFFEAKNIVPNHKIQLIPGEGINLDRFSPALRSSGKEFTFIMVSRLLWSKGVGVLAEAAAILRKKGRVARFQLLGKPESVHPDAVSSKQLTQWQDEGLLEYMGESDDIPAFLGRADCFVLPTYYEEGVPRSIMEASAMEIPVIASRQVGCDVLVKDQETGYLCALKDPEDLALKMEKMMDLSPAERAEMGRRGRMWMKSRFDMNIVLNIYEETIKEFLS